MSLHSIAAAWNEFFFKRQSPYPIAIYRILFGLLVTAKLLLLWPDWLNWFGQHAWVTLQTMHVMEPGTRINLFDVLPQGDFWIEVFFWIGLVAALCVAAGYLTRFNCLLVFLVLNSLDERALYSTNAGDSVLRIASFFLIFSSAGSVLSLDRFIRRRKEKETAEVPLQPVWAQRMIQFLAALVYFGTFCWKSTGTTWVDGTALYYVHHLDEFRRFPVPGFLDTPPMIKVQTWFALAAEFSLGVLIWIKELRYWVLLAGVLLHLILEYSMNVPLFQFIMLSTYILFIDPADLDRAWALWRGFVRERRLVRAQ